MTQFGRNLNKNYHGTKMKKNAKKELSTGRALTATVMDCVLSLRLTKVLET